MLLCVKLLPESKQNSESKDLDVCLKLLFTIQEAPKQFTSLIKESARNLLINRDASMLDSLAKLVETALKLQTKIRKSIKSFDSAVESEVTALTDSTKDAEQLLSLLDKAIEKVKANIIDYSSQILTFEK